MGCELHINIGRSPWPDDPLTSPSRVATCTHWQRPTRRVPRSARARCALTEALNPRRVGWLHAHFGDPLTDPAATPSAVVHGAVLYAIERCGDALDDAALGRAGDALHVAFARAFAARADGVLPSYRGLVWVTDSLPALAAMALRARREGRADRPGWDRWRATVEASSLDATTGLLIAPLHAVSRRAMGPPRGSAAMMAQPYLAVLDTSFARAQWASAELHLLVAAGGLEGAREHLRGMERPPDLDSGRVVFGMGETASGFVILAAATSGAPNAPQKPGPVSARREAEGIFSRPDVGMRATPIRKAFASVANS